MDTVETGTKNRCVMVITLLRKLRPHKKKKKFRKIYMKSNYERSKTIIRKTTKSYHPRADDPRVLRLCRHISIEALKTRRKAIDYLCIIVH